MNALDPLPLWLLYLLIVGLALGAAELGYWLGSRRQRSSPDDGEAAIGGMVAATLGLLAFLMAFLTSMALDRFDARRALVVTDANAIGTASLRARYLPEPERTEALALYRDYVDARIPGPGFDLATSLARSTEIQDRLWSQVLELADGQSGSELFSLYVDALNDMIDAHGMRSAAVRARVPPSLVFLVLGIVFLALFLVGYGDSYRHTRSWVGLTVTTLVFAAVIVLVLDLDRPLDGILTANQQPMIDLQQALDSGAPPAP